MNRLHARHLPAAVGRVRDTLRTGDLDTRTDPDLLDRYARYGDHPAFEAVVRRHGPMVLGVCRRVLGNAADADDAFQATFLVLIRRARSVHGERLGPWLYGVAVRVALKARGRAARVAARQTEVTDMIPDPAAPADPPDWLPILDAELNALPAKYREPMVLCELQGATRAEAAGALGIPEGTLSSRLARGRQLLRKRLLRHGTLLPAGGLVALLGAGGTGRATIPLELFTRTAGLAATGAGAAGAVPAGPARLTDEVMKDMFLTKLRVAGGAVLAAGLVAAGLVAAWPGEAPGQPPERKAAAKVAETPPRPGKSGDVGPARPDREAVQGLWVMEKLEVGKKARPELHKEAGAVAGKMRVLVAGDVWWVMGPVGNIVPHKGTLDPAKNPKWLDLAARNEDGTFPPRSIYQLDGDHLRICVAESDQIRPAEFATDESSPLVVLHFHREPLPPPAGEKGLAGSWETDRPLGFDPDTGKAVQARAGRVEMTGEFFFALFPKEGHPDGVWVGGRYTVDTTKNPKWIDVDLVGAYPNEKVTKLHGSYEAEGGRLKLALGLTGQRAFRPLDLTPALGDRKDQLFFELRPATTSPVDRTKDAVPVPGGKPSSAPRPKDATPVVPMPKLNRGSDAMPAIRPEPPTGAFGKAVEQAIQFWNAGRFAEAEACWRKCLQSPPKDWSDSAYAKMMLGMCLIQRAAPGTKPPVEDPARTQEEAIQLFKQVIADVDARRRAGRTDATDEWVRKHAGLWVIKTYLPTGKPGDALAEADKLLQAVAGTVDELIVLSLMYHAYRQQNKPGSAAAIRGRMQEAFDKLKDRPNVFPAKTGEYSREYWEKVWFAPDPPLAR